MKAFPNPMTLDRSGRTVENQVGMDLRDYFASKIIVALIPNNQSPEMIPYVCEAAYKWADTMMEARK